MKSAGCESVHVELESEPPRGHVYVIDAPGVIRHVDPEMIDPPEGQDQ